MRSYLLPSFLLLIIAISSSCSKGVGAPSKAVGAPRDAVPIVERPRVDSPAALAFQQRLRSEGRDLNDHGFYVEELGISRTVLAASNEDVLYNPASVMKLATSTAALEALGPDHRFVTEFRTEGEVSNGILDADLILHSGGDPSFSIQDARNAGDALRQMGIRRVTGNLVVVGNFTCNENSQTDISAGVFRRQSRLAISGPTRYVTALPVENVPKGKVLFRLESDRLLDIIHYQNAYSVNAMADMLATHFGGPDGVRRFLLDHVGVKPDKICLTSASGLEFNRLSARDTVEVTRTLVNWLQKNNIPIDAVLPVAGVDSSTLTDRFADAEYAGSVIAKTGTLHQTDGGVAALAGIAYTAGHGPVLFAVYDMAAGRGIEHLRHLQDDFLKQLISELGGPDTRMRSTVVLDEPREVKRPLSRLSFPAGQNAE
jgi:D-alanyl-D-alanine carboxypeptidase/D-alanyl-D-alanine-endopeptidase (penicillin-binding protein 4)